jgi:hypothetical protein
MLCNIIWKKSKFKYQIQGIFFEFIIYNINRFHFFFYITLVLFLINCFFLKWNFNKWLISKLFFTKKLIAYLWLLPWKKFICDMIIIKCFKWYTNLFPSYGITMFSNTTNFINIKNNFNIFLLGYHFLICCDAHFLFMQIYSNIVSYKTKNCSFFGI